MPQNLCKNITNYNYAS